MSNQGQQEQTLVRAQQESYFPQGSTALGMTGRMAAANWGVSCPDAARLRSKRLRPAISRVFDMKPQIRTRRWR